MYINQLELDVIVGKEVEKVGKKAVVFEIWITRSHWKKRISGRVQHIKICKHTKHEKLSISVNI